MEQHEQPTQTQSTEMQTNNVKKTKPKRGRIIIRDPRDNKDITHEVLHSSTTNDRSGDNPSLTNSPAQMNSSKIQAQSAPQLAPRLGAEKGEQVKKALYKFLESF